MRTGKLPQLDTNRAQAPCASTILHGACRSAGNAATLTVMEEVLGGYIEDNRFAAFLANWEAILTQRVKEAVAAFSPVNGLNLPGCRGRGAPWKTASPG